mgnify:CR=1 FL=1
MSSLDIRLGLLRDSDFLSEDNYQYIKEIIAFLEQELGTELTEDNAAALITHMAAAFERISKGEPVLALDPIVYEATKEEPSFPKANALSLAIQEKYPFIPDEEVQYITMHLGTMLSSE